MTSTIPVQIPYRPEFFFRPYFHFCSSSIHYWEDRSHIHNSSSSSSSSSGRDSSGRDSSGRGSRGQ